MEKEICRNCEHYRQHYGIDAQKIYQLYCGHCALQTPKHKKPETKACERFALRPFQEETFVTKEFLTKKLLEYVLSLELLPQIEGGANSAKGKLSRER